MKLKDKLALLNFSDSQKRLFKILGIVLGAFILLIIIISIIKGCSSGKMSYEQLENNMVRAAENYVKDEPTVIKDEVFGTTTITVDTLVSKKYMKEMSKYLGKGTTCTGSVLVYKNLDDLTYMPKLDCGDAYKANSISEYIRNNTEVVTTGSGLYKNNDSYYYRGEYVDNYVKYSDKVWRIISIDKDGYIKLIETESNSYSIWDDRYNSNYGYVAGINDFEGVEASRIKDSILNAYNDKEIITKDARKLIVPDQYCVGKRSMEDTTKDGSTECSKKTELMGAGGLTIYEYMAASLDSGCKNIKSKECTNYNFLAKFGGIFWTITANAANTGEAYAISSKVQPLQTASSYPIKLVVKVNGNINYKDGTGTETDPYIIK
ncbi:MAG TPA: hypothetical protein PLV83_03590 [Bacilli bacterium]|nr:hypothetical protein [Bacilli bacterium]